MDILFNDIQDEDSINFKENKYKYSSCILPKSIISTSESSDSTRFETFTIKNVKRVSFNQNVTVINIKSHKKDTRKHNHQKYTSIFEEDFNEDKNQKCVNCNIF